MADPLFALLESPKAVPVSGVDGVFVRATAFIDVLAYQDRLKAAGEDNAKYVDANARLIAASVCDESGALRYTSADVEKLSGLPFTAMKALVDAIARVNGLNSKDVETEAKNS